VGDSVTANPINWSNNTRGIFANGSAAISFASIADGTSNTLMLSEHLVGTPSNQIKRGVAHSLGTGIETNPALCLAQISPTDPNVFATGTVAGWPGTKWAHGSASHIAFNTVLPPNSPSCGSTNNDDSSSGVFPPSSNHPGGVNSALADGSVRFISETIDSGNPTLAPATSGASRYGVWGALGTKDGGETVSDF
jgi:prepilin-type processing-associated H-X9-DG protein